MNKKVLVGLLVGAFGVAVAVKAIKIHKENQKESDKENCSTVVYSMEE